MDSLRKIIFYKNYFLSFYLKLNKNIQDKFDYILRLIETVNRIPEKFLKHIEGYEDLYEIRVEYEGNIYRIFCCFDKRNIIILFNAFHKKSQKTPIKELKLANKLKTEYFNSQK